MRSRAIVLFMALCAGICSLAATAQNLESLEFRNQEIVDILAVLGKVAGKSIIADSTVSGRATYFFTDIEFEQAFEAFLSTYKLSAVLRNGVYYVSRISTRYLPETGTVDVDAEDVDVTLLVRAVSLAAGKTVLYDPLPKRDLTVHLREVPLETALSVFIHQLPEFVLETNSNFFYLRNITPSRTSGIGVQRRQEYITTDESGLYGIEAKQARLSDILEELFKKSGGEYTLLMRPETTVETVSVTGRNFEQILRYVLDQAGADYSVEDEVYQIFEIQKRDVLKNLKTTELLQLSYLDVQDLPNLLPQELSTPGFFKLDRSSNTVILSGSEEEIAPLRSFIRTIDRPADGMAWERFDLRHRNVKDVVPLLLARYQGIQPQIVPDTNSFTVFTRETNRKAIDEFLALIDVPAESVPVRLRYITARTLLENLPPSVGAEDIVPTRDENLIFFTGSTEKRRLFLSELELLDRPEPQIRYELLVVQYNRASGLNWAVETSNAVSSAGDRNVYLGTIGNLLSLNFDIVSSFGYLFAVRLNTSLSQNTARILADTTLNGISGEEIRFQNTTTYRFRDFEIDPDTGKPKPTGITRELTSGLIINVNGWVSGDGMITMKVASTVSKRGTDVSSQNGDPPTTSEKVVSTHVRTPSGTPVVISGLFQQDLTVGVKKVPILGDIPLLGLLFQSRTESVEDTELVIYIVPHLEFPERNEVRTDERLEELYDRFVREEAP